MYNTFNTKSTAPAFERALVLFFFQAVRLGLVSPRLFFKALRIFLSQKRLAAVRKKYRESGVDVPPLIIFSITKRCNLTCKGCYAMALSKSEGSELGEQKIDRILVEAQDLGVSIVLIAGGEPLTRPNILPLLASFPSMIFPMFTNGLLIDDAAVAVLKKNSNIIPVLSLEGNKAHTDQRRGAGVYDGVIRKIGTLRRAGVLCGISLTVTQDNFATVTSDAFIEHSVRQGCLLFFFVEYVPVDSATDHLVLSDDQRNAMTRISAELTNRFKALFIAFPGDEEQFGGCLAAGRGFVHINPTGDVEPCPFAPYSDASLRGLSLREALKSPFLYRIRRHHGLLTEGKSGCSLWENRDRVLSLLHENHPEARDSVNA